MLHLNCIPFICGGMDLEMNTTRAYKIVLVNKILSVSLIRSYVRDHFIRARQLSSVFCIVVMAMPTIMLIPAHFSTKTINKFG